MINEHSTCSIKCPDPDPLVRVPRDDPPGARTARSLRDLAVHVSNEVDLECINTWGFDGWRRVDADLLGPSALLLVAAALLRITRTGPPAR